MSKVKFLIAFLGILLFSSLLFAQSTESTLSIKISTGGKYSVSGTVSSENEREEAKAKIQSVFGINADANGITVDGKRRPLLLVGKNRLANYFPEKRSKATASTYLRVIMN